jgi:hypothetical protein
LKCTLTIELEALELQHALLRERLALCIEAAIVLAGRKLAGAAFERALALHLPKLELLLFHALAQLELVETARIGRAERVAPRDRALPQLKIEGVLLLFDMQATVLGRRARRAGLPRQTDERCQN